MKTSSLGQLELDVLKIIWDKQECTVPEVTEILVEKRGYARTTILTVVQRLHKKGFLQRVKCGGIYHYSPTREKDSVLGSLALQFVKNTFDGSLSGLVQHLASSNASSDELLEMRRIINEAIADEGKNK